MKKPQSQSGINETQTDVVRAKPKQTIIQPKHGARLQAYSLCFLLFLGIIQAALGGLALLQKRCMVPETRDGGGGLVLQEAVYGASGVPVEKIGALDRFKKRKVAD